MRSLSSRLGLSASLTSKENKSLKYISLVLWAHYHMKLLAFHVLRCLWVIKQFNQLTHQSTVYVISSDLQFRLIFVLIDPRLMTFHLFFKNN